MDAKALVLALRKLGISQKAATNTVIALARAMPGGPSCSVEFYGERETARVTAILAKAVVGKATETTLSMRDYSASKIKEVALLRRQYDALKDDAVAGQYLLHIPAGESWRVGLADEEFAELCRETRDEAMSYPRAGKNYMGIPKGSQSARHFKNIKKGGGMESWAAAEAPGAQPGDSKRMVVIPRIYLPRKEEGLVLELRKIKGRILERHRPAISYTVAHGYGEF